MPKTYSNQSRLISKRRSLRKAPTKAETCLWEYIRNKQMGVKFRRQFSIGGCIVDFFCNELKLIIEIDGGIHGEDDHPLKDKKREAWLRTQGYQIIRYTNEQVLTNTEGVYEDLQKWIVLLQSK